MSDYVTAGQQVSYGLGRKMGEQLMQNPFDGLESAAVVTGLSEALKGEASQISDEELRAAFQAINKQMRAKQAAQAKNKSAASEQFLADNAKREEVTTTASGLQYEVLVNGDGEIPTAASTVRTHYHGRLIDGTVFDSSYDRGEPTEFPVGGVIAEWTEALQMMGVGSKWRLAVPYQLAYGEQGADGMIGPYAELIFDVELLDILS